MSSISQIASSTYARRYHRSKYSDPQGPDGKMETGLDLKMTNGTLWFHPYSGADPRRIS